jgi:hypothetical protein
MREARCERQGLAGAAWLAENGADEVNVTWEESAAWWLRGAERWRRLVARVLRCGWQRLLLAGAAGRLEDARFSPLPLASCISNLASLQTENAWRVGRWGDLSGEAHANHPSRLSRQMCDGAAIGSFRYP